MIKKKDKDILKSIAKKNNLKLLILFGSRVNNKNRTDSDWDIAILDKKKLSFNKKMKIFSQLEEITKFNKIDLIDLAITDEPILRQNIFKNGICIYENEKGLFDRELINTIYNYIDYSHLYLIEEEIIKNKLNSL